MKNLTKGCTLSQNSFHEYLHNNALPKLLEKIKKESNDNDNYTMEVLLLKDHSLTCICLSTALRWLHVLGKLFYRRQPLSQKCSKDKFHAHVDYVLSAEVLTMDLCRASARRSHSYMLAYRAIAAAKLTYQKEQKERMEQQQQQQQRILPDPVVEEKPFEDTYDTIEKCQKLKRKMRTHRSTLDSDTKFISLFIPVSNWKESLGRNGFQR